MHRILIPTRLAKEGVTLLEETPGFAVDCRPGLKGKDLHRALAKADAVIIRSDNRIDAAAIAAGKRLRLIGRAGVGLENVDLGAASARGIAVVNTPAANSIAVAELTMAMTLALARKIVPADRSVRAGRWEKSSLKGNELDGKVLGIVGFGRIGREVGRRAAAFGMEILTYDPFVSAESAIAAGATLVGLADLIRRADVVSLHLPLNEKTRGLFGAAELKRMKRSALLINASRGGIVEEAALEEALRAKRLAGCALDVYESEPPANRWFADMDNVVVTPHLGASTEESQTKVAVEIAQSVRLALTQGIYINAVNLPIADPANLQSLHPFLALAERLGVLLRGLEDGPCGALTVELGAATIAEARVIQAAALKGFLSGETDAPITLVNAMPLAAERQIRLSVVDHSMQPAAATSLGVRANIGRKQRFARGVVESGRTIRIQQIDDFTVDLVPKGRALIFNNRDRPGVVGAVGGVLGDAGINIASWLLGRRRRGGTALGVVAVDDPVPADVMGALGQLPNMGHVVQVDWEQAADETSAKKKRKRSKR
jgi:D-3-phosphoglycerate dehydrogenase